MWRTGRRGRRPQDWSPAPRNLPMLSPYHVHQFLHSRGALLQHGHLLRQELHLVDVLDAARAQFHRHSHEQAVNPVFAFQVSGARQHLLLVFEDRPGHLDRGGRRRVVGAAGLEIFHDLCAALARAVDNAVDKRTTGTMVSPWPPITTAVTFSTDTLSSCAMKVRKRALSRMPAIPMTRFLLNLETM